jgi:single-stranded DNA-binding protein
MLLKGNKVGITGELTNRPYQAKDGTEKYSLDVRLSDVTLLGGKPQQASNATQQFDNSDQIPF